MLASDNALPEKHLISANEGTAIAIAAGYHLGTQKIPVVYLQNSGLGNTVNPLLSLADKEVYKIPLICVIGWRGEPGIKDEPQHMKQGKVTCQQLEIMGIPYVVIDGEEKKSLDNITNIINLAKEINSPVAILVKKNSFFKYKLKEITIDEELPVEEKKQLNL